MIIATTILSITTLILLVLFLSSCWMVFKQDQAANIAEKDFNTVGQALSELRKAYDIMQPGTEQLIEMYNKQTKELDKNKELVTAQYDLMQEQDTKFEALAKQLNDKEDYIKKLSRMKVN